MTVTNIARRFLHARTGAVAVEFAMISIPLLMLILAISEAGVDLYLKSALDNAAQNVARQIFTGAAQNMSVNGAAVTQQYFTQHVVCPNLPAVLSCSNVIVNIVNFAETASPTPYYNYVNASSNGLLQPALDNTKTNFCLGTTSSYVILQILYPLPLISSVFGNGPVTTLNGKTVRILFSTAVFRNEPFPSPTYSTC